MHTTTGTVVVTALALVALTGCSGGSTTATAPASTLRTTPAVTTSVAAPTTTVAAARTTPAATSVTTPGPGCGVDLAAPAVAAAVARLRPAFPDRPALTWSPAAQGGNLDPCATLSVALVILADGTGSSPEQLLMFHDGVYQGTGTLEAYGFTSVDVAASTDDTVVVHYGYEKPGETTASASGLVTVRYQWSNGAVHMLDPLPAVITG